MDDAYDTYLNLDVSKEAIQTAKDYGAFNNNKYSKATEEFYENTIDKLKSGGIKK